jgi:hypothetical protein
VYIYLIQKLQLNQKKNLEMREPNIKILKILSVLMIVLSIPYFNVFGIALSIMTLYGLLRKNNNLLQSLLIPNLYEIVMIVLYFIGFFIKLKSSYNVNNKQLEIIISYVLVILTIVQATIQIYISINIYKIVLISYGARAANENELIFIYSVQEEVSRPEEDPLPAYSPPANKLPTYSETQVNVTQRNVTNNVDVSSSEALSNTITTNEEVSTDSNNSNSNTNLTSQENITAVDITELTHNNSEISINPPPYSLLPPNNPNNP